jgi:tRNA (guanine37-N1)-methyltransferase
MRVDCLVACMNALDESTTLRAHRVLLSPQGTALDQRGVERLVERPALMLVCGRYEGVDERLRSYVDEELSVGDFVLSGGEVAAMAVVDACARLLPGVLGNPASLDQESHSAATGGALEYPQYTRPVEFDGRRVPEVLLGGNHAEIAAWRREQARARTAQRRPDLLARDVDEPSKGSS